MDSFSLIEAETPKVVDVMLMELPMPVEGMANPLPATMTRTAEDKVNFIVGRDRRIY